MSRKNRRGHRPPPQASRPIQATGAHLMKTPAQAQRENENLMRQKLEAIAADIFVHNIRIDPEGDREPNKDRYFAIAESSLDAAVEFARSAWQVEVHRGSAPVKKPRRPKILDEDEDSQE